MITVNRWCAGGAVTTETGSLFQYFTSLTENANPLLRPARSGLTGHPYKVLQGPSQCRRRGSAFSIGVMKYWNKLPVSVITAPSVNIFKKRLEKVWTKILPHPTRTPSINSYHLYTLPTSLFYVCGLFRPVVAYFLPL